MDNLSALWDRFKINAGGNIGDVVYPLASLTKKELVLGLPEELRALTSYCRQPKSDYSGCGECRTCLEVTAPTAKAVGAVTKRY